MDKTKEGRVDGLQGTEWDLYDNKRLNIPLRFIVWAAGQSAHAARYIEWGKILPRCQRKKQIKMKKKNVCQYDSIPQRVFTYMIKLVSNIISIYWTYCATTSAPAKPSALLGGFDGR